jgi:hypothetical protein
MQAAASSSSGSLHHIKMSAKRGTKILIMTLSDGKESLL